MPTITDPVDLLLGPDHDLVIGTDLSLSTGLDAIAQGIKVRLLTVRGEWRLNLDSGVPYYEDILGQRFDQTRIHAAIREAILSTPGVRDIISLESSFDGATRTLSVAWEVTSIYGTIADSLEI